MAILSVTERGQVTFRKEILAHLGIAPGEKIEMDLLPDGKGLVRAARPPETLDNFIGVLAGKRRIVASIEEISAAATRGWAGQE